MTNPSLFNEKRTAQAAAFLLHRAGGRLPLLKLMKLMYLAERESLKEYGEPITGDKLVAMPHGPVLSITYNLMNGALDSQQGGWESWMEDRAGHDVALRDESRIRSPEQDLLELSQSDLDVLQGVWEKFGHMSKWDIRDYTHHGGCPEWEDPNGSSRPIPMTTLFKALGYSEEGVRSAIEHLRERENLGHAFG
ncbi:DUF4065 domain-containing protein [Corticibacter populi]|uniref:DUF4065 domain-containing protein n=1 Tax=Corticibacter populi TaxID=1550736 RepID=A0A3M6QZY9_9BURK|nr:Panacea domain-containing protein [Corticibacter populi]RMX08521.1 DUF4065 domain-containing protein [Corticibacter populi]RZS35838.1 putative phage-associated protein [Corticibacter populi]